MAQPHDPREVLGAVLGIAGAFLLAGNDEASRFGWLGFLGSNLLLMHLFAARRMFWLLVMQLAFTATTLRGIWNTFGTDNEYKLELLCEDSEVDALSAALLAAARTGQAIAGWITVIDVVSTTPIQ